MAPHLHSSLRNHQCNVKFQNKHPNIDMGVSKNNGTPKSSIFIGFSIINHPFWGTSIFGNTHMESYGLEYPTDWCLILQGIGSYGINPVTFFITFQQRTNLTHSLQGGLVIPRSFINSHSFKMLWVLCLFGCWPKVSTQENLEIRRLDGVFHPRKQQFVDSTR